MLFKILELFSQLRAKYDKTHFTMFSNNIYVYNRSLNTDSMKTEQSHCSGTFQYIRGKSWVN